MTDFLFENDNHVQHGTTYSRDTTMVNFLQLLAERAFDFAANNGIPAFVEVNVQTPKTICIINGSGFDNNAEAWAKKTFTESCPIPWTNATDNGTKGCPQVLAGGGVVACGPTTTPCVTQPTGIDCAVNIGCPSTGNGPHSCKGKPCDETSSGWVLSPLLSGLTVVFFVL
jgi:hypothetical protein